MMFNSDIESLAKIERHLQSVISSSLKLDKNEHDELIEAFVETRKLIRQKIAALNLRQRN